MGILHVVDHNSSPTHANSGAVVASWSARIVRAARSGVFLTVTCTYLACVMGLGQRLIVLPLITLAPGRRRRVMRWWLRCHAHATLNLARVLANMRVSVHGAIGPESCIVVMNHQSLYDIPLGLSLIPGPQPIIPTRDRYQRGVPGISLLGRMAGFPYLSQGRTSTRAELRALRTVAELVERGEASLLIYPEGHRTTTGDIAPFMTSGLRLLLQRAHRPVYCVVADGMWRARTVANASNFLDANVRVVVLGPFDPPPAGEIDSFIESLRTRMIAALSELRAS